MDIKTGDIKMFPYQTVVGAYFNRTLTVLLTYSLTILLLLTLD